MFRSVPGVSSDLRDLQSGHPIPAQGYCDQPNLLVLSDGTWLCLLTTSSGHEGAQDQHLRALRSRDGGLTWDEPVRIEPPDEREASYGCLLMAPSGRIFCFYNFNHENVRQVPGDNPPFKDGWCRRVDCLGQFVYRWSDDGGRTWSANRAVIPVREFAIDRQNSSQGAIRYFWNPGKPTVSGSRALVPLTKVEGFGEPFYRRSEGVILGSDDLFAVADPATATWQTYPSGDVGKAAPGGLDPIAEEHSLCSMGDSSLVASFRTRSGRGACYYSHDGGTTWTDPEWPAYLDGRLVKHPQANFPIWPLRDGTFLMWFHHEGSKNAVKRNPVWLARGWEHGGRILWGEPEIALYDLNPATRVSYPDFVEIGDRWILTETQKSIARWHEVDAEVQAALLGKAVTPEPSKIPAAGANGFSIQINLPDADRPTGECLLAVAGIGRLLGLSRHQLEWLTEDGCRLRVDLEPANPIHQLTLIAETRPGLILWVVNGRLNDGGDHSPCGWQWHPVLREFSNQPITFHPSGQLSGPSLFWSVPLKVACAGQSNRH